MKQKYIFVFILLSLGGSLNIYAQSSGFYMDPDWGEYPFKPGDALSISTLPDTTSILNGIYKIDDRGYAEFPILGKILVSQMTVQELVEFLKKNYIDYLRVPNIYVKPLVRVSLLGGFTRPGLYYVDINYSLWDLIQLAGGTVRKDGIYDLHWQRGEKDQSDELVRYFENGTSLKKMGFRSGDIFWTKAPDERTFWDVVRDVVPIISFATSAVLTYYTIQQQAILYQYRR